MTGGSAERVRWGDWGEAVPLAFRYTHPRTGADVEMRQAVRVPRDLPFALRIGEGVQSERVLSRSSEPRSADALSFPRVPRAWWWTLVH